MITCRLSSCKTDVHNVHLLIILERLREGVAVWIERKSFYTVSCDKHEALFWTGWQLTCPKKYFRARANIRPKFVMQITWAGTSEQLMLFCCLHCLSSVWQSVLFTTSYLKHNRPTFDLVLCPQLRRRWGGILLWGCPCMHDSFHPSRFLMHTISYEQCMLGFWNLMYVFLMEK